MKKSLIAIVIAILAGFGIMTVGTNDGVSPLGWGGGGDSAYVTEVIQATTSISTCARSVYWEEPTSTDPSAPTLLNG